MTKTIFPSNLKYMWSFTYFFSSPLKNYFVYGLCDFSPDGHVKYFHVMILLFLSFSALKPMVGHCVFVLPVKSCKFVFYLTFTTFIATVFVFLQNQYIGIDSRLG